MTADAHPQFFFEDLQVGMEAELTRPVSERDIEVFAEVSGDHNPIHVDADYAAGSIFKERIAHGILTASFISAVFAMKLPGKGAIYVSQTLNFKGPVKIDDVVTARVKVIELIERRHRARFECVCLKGDKPVVEGEAVMMVPSKSAT